MKASKKLLSLVLASIMIVTSLLFSASTAQAIAYAAGHFTYEVADNDEVTLTGLTQEGKEELAKDATLEIPGTINDKPVKYIKDRAFQNLKIASVSFPDANLIRIGEAAFQGNELKDVTIKADTIAKGAFAQNQIKTIDVKDVHVFGDDAFRDNKIESLQLSSAVEIGKSAFQNNRIGSLHLGYSINKIDDYAFSINRIRSVELLPIFETPKLGKEVFSKNGGWVKVTTGNSGVKSAKYESGFGHVVNPVTVNVRYLTLEATNPFNPNILKVSETIRSDKIIGDDLTDKVNVFPKGDKATLQADKFSGYELVGYLVNDHLDESSGLLEDYLVKEMGVVRTRSGNISFTPDRDEYPITLIYKKSEKTPTITFSDDYKIVFDFDETIDASVLLRGVKATDYKGNDISDKIEVSPKKVDSSISGSKTVSFIVRDSEGNEATAEKSISVGVNWPKVDVGEGWLIEDFTYEERSDGSAIVTGFSDSGVEKLKSGKSTLYIPTHDTQGRVVTEIGGQAFDYNGYSGLNEKSIRKIATWANVEKIGDYIFGWSLIDEIPDTWENVTYIGGSVFQGQRDLKKIPDNWGRVTHIGDGAFFNLTVDKIPDNWGNVREIGEAAFSQMGIREIPDDWGNVEKIGPIAFETNKIEKIPADWKKIVSIEDRTFSDNKIKKIDSWHGIESIDMAAFKGNLLEQIPDSWDTVRAIKDEAFHGNNLVHAGDDWGQVAEIGSYAFLGNRLETIPDDWGVVSKIGKQAFSGEESRADDSRSMQGNRIKSVPESFGSVVTIGPKAFYDNEISEFAQDWGSVREMGYLVFSKNKIQALPDDWKSVTKIGAGAFAQNEIRSIPETWGDNFGGYGEKLADKYTNSRGEDVYVGIFEENKIEKIPSDWSNIYKIPNFLFSKNNIKEIPDNWNGVKFIGGGAFAYNDIEKIPSNWGRVSGISTGISSSSLGLEYAGAFKGNKIREIPNDWGGVTWVGVAAFDGNQIQEVPNDWKNINLLQVRAFANNPNLVRIPETFGKIPHVEWEAFAGNPNLETFPEDLRGVKEIGFNAFEKAKKFPEKIYLTDEYLTGDLLKQISNSSEGHGPKTVNVFTDKRTNPNGVAGIYKADRDITFVINPVKLDIKYQDEQGNDLLPELSKYVPRSELDRLAPPPVFGYETPGAVGLSGGSDSFDYTFVYKKLSDDEIAKRSRGVLKLKTGTKDNPQARYFIGDKMTGVLAFDMTGFDAKNVVNPTFRVDFENPDFFDSFVEVPRELAGANVSNVVMHDGYFTFDYNGVISGGTTLEIPFLVKFNREITPSDTPMNVRATLTEKGEAIAESNKDSFTGFYNTGHLTVHANGSADNGRIEDYDRKIISKEPHDSYVAFEGDNKIDYRIYYKDAQRNIGDYTITVKLPEYRVHKKAQVAGAVDERALAKFDPKENPGWVLSDDKKSVSFTGNNGNSTAVISQPLTLRYPGNLEGSNIQLAADIVAQPFGKYSNEKAMVDTGEISNYFARLYIPEGEIFAKYSIMPDNFYDNIKGKSAPKLWSLHFNGARFGLTNMRITDYDLDKRFYYTAATMPKEFGPGKVVAYDDKGASLWSQNIDPNDPKTLQVNIPEKIGRATDKLVFTADEKIPAGVEGVIILETKVRDLSETKYDHTPGNKNNLFKNGMLFEADGVKGSAYAQKYILKSGDAFRAYKDSSYQGDVITGSNGVYDVGFVAPDDLGDDIYGFRLVDLLPKGLNIYGFEMSQKFKEIPGATVRFESNYNNSGHDAIVWEAPKIPYSAYTADAKFSVGTISSSIDILAPSGKLRNEVFAQADNLRELNVNNDVRLPDDKGDWSSAQVDTEFTPATLMAQKKSIRAYENGKPGPWLEHVSTIPNQRIDYRLELINGTDTNRVNPKMYDVFPFVGDQGIGEFDKGLARESQFANVFDVSRAKDIMLPRGMMIQYYNSDTPVPHYTANTVDKVLESLSWSNTPAKNTRAIRIVPKPGQTVTLKSRSKFDITIPMLANNSLQDGLPGVPSDNTAGKKAYNSFFEKDNTQKRLIEGNRVSNTMVRKPVDVTLEKRGYNRVLKGDSALQGAVFEYRRADDTLVKTAISDKNGQVRFGNIAPQQGDYVIETKAPEGYILSNEKREITHDMLLKFYAAGAKGALELGVYHNQFTIPLYKPTGGVKFTKVDASGAPLAGAVFTLTRTWQHNGVEHKASFEATSNDQGVVEFKNVSPGFYTLSETKTPGIFQPIVPIKNVKVESRKTTSLSDVVNDKIGLKVAKIGVEEAGLVDAEGNTKQLGQFTGLDGGLLAGAEMELVDVATGEVKKFTTSKETSIVDGIKVDTNYLLREVKAPRGYEHIPGVTDKGMQVRVNARGEIFNHAGKKYPVQSIIYFPNIKGEQETTIKVVKQGDDGKPLAGAGFWVEKEVGRSQDKDGNPIIEWKYEGINGVTNEHGILVFDNLAPGNYRVKEMTPPVGYLKTDKTYTFNVNKYVGKEYTAKFTNTRIKPSIRKVDYVARGVSSAVANSIINSMENNQKVKKISRGGDVFDVVRPLQGAKFALRNMPNGEDVEIIETDENGIGKITTPLNVDTSAYYIVEIEAPEGYKLDKTPHEIKIHDYTVAEGFDGTIEMVIDNSPATGSLVISKLNSDTSDTIRGGSATFKVKQIGVEEPFEAEITTNPENGSATLDDLPYGDYTIVETRAPEGYVIDSNPVNFTVNEKQSTFSHVWGNDPVNPKIKVTKYINGHDANHEASAVMMNSGVDEMEVKFVVENVGNTILKNVTVSDEVIRGGEKDKIQKDLAKAVAFVENFESSKNLETPSGRLVNGEFALAPGGKATFYVDAETPMPMVMHEDKATATGIGPNGEVVEDDDPAHAVKIDVAFRLPHTGTQGLVGMGLIMLVLIGASFYFVRRRV